MARRRASKSVERGMRLRSDHGNGLSMSSRVQEANDNAVTVTDLTRQQITLQLPQCRRSDRQNNCDPRSSRQGLTVANCDGIALDDDRCNESYSSLAVAAMHSPSEAAIAVPKKHMPSEASDCVQQAHGLHNDDYAIEVDDADEVELISYAPINDTKSNPLFIQSNIKTRNLPARKTQNPTHQILNGSNQHQLALPTLSSADSYQQRRSQKSANNANDWEEVARYGINNDDFAAPTCATANNVDDSNNGSKCSRPLLHDSVLDFQVSSKPTKTPDGKYICRAISCQKLRSGKHGFCCNHNNRFLISTGQSSWWECKCGSRNLDSFKRCSECQKWRHGRVFPKISRTNDSSIVLEKKSTRSIRKMVGEKIGVMKEEVRDANDAADTSAVSEESSNEKITYMRQEEIVSSHTTTTTSKVAGIRSLQTYVPPDLVPQISTQQRRNSQGRAYCKFITCQKLDQSNMDGFCKCHFNMFALNDTEEDLNPGVSLDRSWVCKCGQLMGGERTRCSNCRKSKKKGGKRSKKSRDQKRRRLLLDELSLDSFPSPDDDTDATKNFGISSFSYSYDNYAKDWCSDTKHPSDGAKCYGQNVTPHCTTNTQNSDKREDGDDPCTTDAKPKAEIINEDGNESRFGNLEVQAAVPPENTGQRREIQLDHQKSTRSQKLHWRCLRCENLNTPQNSCCSTCRYQFEQGVRSSPSELSLLERTRYELLNGHDFWICTHCVIAIPSITMPCGKCKRMITFVPLEMEEFEEFVRKQREKPCSSFGNIKRCKSSLM